MSKKQPNSATFDFWSTSDAHIIREALGEGVDPRRMPRASMEQAIGQVEGPDGFHYDIAFHLGDILDYNHETAENFQKFRKQLSCSKKDPHCWYHLGGNNDENSVLNDGVALDNEHYRKHIDPVGEFTQSSGIDNARRPFAVEGTYERYAFDVGNVRFVCLSDRNDLPAPYGRGEGGFYVDGAITLESFQWLVRQIITYPDRILVVACHHPLKDTTIGTQIDDSWKGQYMTPYNPQRAHNPAKRLQSTLHQVYPIHEFDTPLFHRLLRQNHGAVDIWMSGHVHHRVEETFEGRGKYARVFGGHHLNIGNLCRYRHMANIISAQSTLFSCRVGQSEILSRVYVHDHPELPAGFYQPEQHALPVKAPFAWQASSRKVGSPTAGLSELAAEKVGPHHTRLRWASQATGVLIVKSSSPRLSFRPADNAVYYAGQNVDHGEEVIFAGTARQTDALARPTAGDLYLHALRYNAANGRICYADGDPETLRLASEGSANAS